MKRREFLALLGTLPFSGCNRRPSGIEVNDVHSRLNPSRVARLIEPVSVTEVQTTVRKSASLRQGISIAGGRHAMGGQQFGEGTTLIDMRRMNRVLGLNSERGLIEVEAGIEWPELIDHMHAIQQGAPKQWGIVQKQTGADRLTIGGALAADAHGRGLMFAPIVQDVEAFEVINAAGERVRCSRADNLRLGRQARPRRQTRGTLDASHRRTVRCPRRNASGDPESRGIDPNGNSNSYRRQSEGSRIVDAY